ncbi:MAG: hypothetical protein AAGH79_17085 [Bacteroidota bacterium]
MEEQFLLYVDVSANSQLHFYQGGEDVATCNLRNSLACYNYDYVGIDLSSEFYGVLDLEDMEYQEVFQIAFDPAMDNGLEAFYWSKNEGLVQFTRDNMVWNLVQ